MNSILLPIINNLFSFIPDHVYRMNQSKQYLEDKYKCLESHGNYVLMTECPNWISDNFLVKNIPNFATRVTLADISIFKNAELSHIT